MEKLLEKIDLVTKRPLYSLRVTHTARVIALVDGGSLVLLSVVADSDKPCD